MVKDAKMTEERYLGIVGSRDRNTPEDFAKVLTAYQKVISRDKSIEWTIVSGGAKKGADRFAYLIAEEYGHDMLTRFPKLRGCETYLEKTKAYYARNTKIAQISDIMIACIRSDRRGGTGNTISKFKLYNPGGELIEV